ncbi:hypothetical protein, partial [Nocardia brasiliensis]|uniref:hypothetical protein n=1 Tax=Nocardia brasiliensis TaxID=37326 RepID=UPI0024547AD8
MADDAGRAGMDTIMVQKLSEDDWHVNREVAIRSIQDTPWAHKLTPQAAARTEQDWRKEISGFSSMFVAMRGGRPIGQTAATPSWGFQVVGGAGRSGCARYR